MKRVFRSSWALIAAAAPAAAQCSMCRTALSANGHHAGDAFNRAIVILLLPAVVTFGTIFLAACRYAGSGGDEDPDERREE
jgi:hypothetical protein